MSFIPKPIKVKTPLDRIQLSEDGWLSLWDSEHPESRIEVKLDASPNVENRINGLAFEGLGEDGEGLVAGSMGEAAEIITGNRGDDSDWLHVSP